MEVEIRRDKCIGGVIDKNKYNASGQQTCNFEAIYLLIPI